MKSYEIGGAGRTYEAEEIRVQSFGTETGIERGRPLAKPHPGREDNVQVDLKFVGWEGVDWIHVAESSET
jgi:hypothetical protein